MTVPFPPKYPPKFEPGETACVVIGGYKGKPVKILSVEPGYPYANYKVLHETDGEMHLNERELGKTKETSYARKPTAAERAV